MESKEADKTLVVHQLKAWDAQAVTEVIEFRGETTVVVPREHLLRAADYLASEPSLHFSFLSDITTVDRFPLEPRFEVNYHLLSLDRNERLRLKVRLGGSDPSVHSVTGLAHRELARARDFRSVRHPFRRPSRLAPHPDAGRLGRPSAAQGLSRRRVIDKGR